MEDIAECNVKCRSEEENYGWNFVTLNQQFRRDPVRADKKPGNAFTHH